MKATIQKIRFDDSFANNNGIRSVKQKGSFSMTIKCVNEEEAKKVETQIKQKYVTIRRSR